MQEKQCSRCGAAFGCGRDDTTCWCVELPLLPGSALDAGADCLCPRCLAAALEA
ncbi:MAG: cysteine-rich CWC family protein, partial [Gammaproteobacteria bacterium]